MYFHLFKSGADTRWRKMHVSEFTDILKNPVFWLHVVSVINSDYNVGSSGICNACSSRAVHLRGRSSSVFIREKKQFQPEGTNKLVS